MAASQLLSGSSTGRGSALCVEVRPSGLEPSVGGGLGEEGRLLEGSCVSPQGAPRPRAWRLLPCKSLRVDTCPQARLLWIAEGASPRSQSIAASVTCNCVVTTRDHVCNHSCTDSYSHVCPPLSLTSTHTAVPFLSLICT